MQVLLLVVSRRVLKGFTVEGRYDLKHVGSCQNYGPFLGTLNIRCRIIIRTQKGTIILTCCGAVRASA